MDFTLKTYTKFLKSLISCGYAFQTFREFLENPIEKCIILRHDVDLLPQNSLKFARIENNLGVKSTFFFQIDSKIYKRDIVDEISDLGHEIGYHYKDIETVSNSKFWNWNDNLNYELIIDLGYESFLKNLKKMREDVDIKTICMHGSPRCRLDNKIIWQKYDYRKLGLIGEPYYAVNWGDVAYLTDSGRRWNGEKFIVRDKVNSKFQFNFYSTLDIIKNSNSLPKKVMITTHPQRWSNNYIEWGKEILTQNLKNLIKRKFYVERPYIDLQNLSELKSKKFLFMLGHPAHFHLFKNSILQLKERGHQNFILIKNKDVLENLLIESGFQYKNILTKERKKNVISFFFNSMIRGSKILYYSLKNKPDLLIGTSVEITHVGRLLRIPSIVVNEDDSAVVPLFAYSSYPFAQEIITPISTNNGRWEDKSIKYRGYHELAYLTPKYFRPQKDKVSYLFEKGPKYFILRFAELTAHHDFGKGGITTELARKIINKLEPNGTVYISSERELEAEFEKYRIQLDPKNMHDAIYYASLFIGDSQTMAAESAVLGTPSLRYNDFVGSLGYLEELEHKYHLTFGFKTDKSAKLLKKIDELLLINDLNEVWRVRRDQMLKENIQLSDYFSWFFENYPLSRLMHDINPQHSNKFAISNKKKTT